MDRQFRKDFIIFDKDDFFYDPMPKYVPLLENNLYQPRMTIAQQKKGQHKNSQNQVDQYYYSCNTGEVNGIKRGHSVEAKTKLVNGKLVKNVKKTKYNEDGTKDVQEFIEDENGYRVNNFQLDKPAEQQQLNEMVNESEQQLLEPPSLVKKSTSQQLQKHEDPFQNMGQLFKDFEQDFFRNPFQELSLQKSLSLFDKNDFFGQDQFFGKEFDNWLKDDDFFKFPKLNWGETQQNQQEQPVNNQQKYTIRQFQKVKDGNKTGHIIEKQEKNENGKVSRQLKKVKLNQDGTKDVHEIVENENGKIENIKKLNKDNQQIAQIKDKDDVIIEDEKGFMNN